MNKRANWETGFYIQSLFSFVYTHSYTQTYAHTYTHKHTRIHSHVSTHVRVRKHASRSYTHAHTTSLVLGERMRGDGVGGGGYWKVSIKIKITHYNW